MTGTWPWNGWKETTERSHRSSKFECLGKSFNSPTGRPDKPGGCTNKIKSVQICKMTSTVISCLHCLVFALKNSDDDIVDVETIINFKINWPLGSEISAFSISKLNFSDILAS